MRWLAFAIGVALAVAALPCQAQGQQAQGQQAQGQQAQTQPAEQIPPATTQAPAMVPPTGPDTKSGHRNECHTNSRGQLVCRQCWHEHGKVHCSQPRIVRKTEQPSN